MAHGIKKFDRDSSYYPDLELSNPPVPEFKPKRAFYDRQLENDVLYMRLGAINKYTGENVSRSLTEHSGVKGLIIDLRGNPGGMLQEAVRVAGLFIDGGIVASSKGRSPDSTEYYNAPAGDVLDNKPIVVLIDGADGFFGGSFGGSASGTKPGCCGRNRQLWQRNRAKADKTE